MTIDIQYKTQNYQPSRQEHLYGKNVHILSHPYYQTLLTQFCKNDMHQPHLSQTTRKLYQYLLSEVVATQLKQKVVKVETRMKELIEQGELELPIIDPHQSVVIVDLARAGILPSMYCHEELATLINPERIRQDHFYMNRKVNKKQEVIGVDVSGSKIGGDKEDSIVLFPDPMGATGSSLSYTIDYYKNNVPVLAAKYVAIHLIITPEYIQRMTHEHPDVEIFTLRLDRGLSSEKILQTLPGTHSSEEFGLTDTQYIVPGAGGVGEILNNSFV